MSEKFEQKKIDSPGPLRAASVNCRQAAKIFSGVYGETFTPDQVRTIATEADIRQRFIDMGLEAVIEWREMSRA